MFLKRGLPNPTTSIKSGSTSNLGFYYRNLNENPNKSILLGIQFQKCYNFFGIIYPFEYFCIGKQPLSK